MVLPYLADPLLQALFNPLVDALFSEDGSVKRLALEGDMEGLAALVNPALKTQKGIEYKGLYYDAMFFHAKNLLPFFSWLLPATQVIGLSFTPTVFEVRDGMGYAHKGYMTTRDSEREIPMSFSVRIKDYNRLVLKLFANIIDYPDQASAEIHDGIAFRIICGETDSKDFPGGKSGLLFDPASEHLDRIIRHMTGMEDEFYYRGLPGGIPDKAKIDLINEYNRRINRLISQYDFTYSVQLYVLDSRSSPYTDLRTYTRLQEVARKLAIDEGISGDYIRDEDLQDLALQRTLTRTIRGKFGSYRDNKFRDYVLYPRKPNGYSAVHIVFEQLFGFTTLLNEVQIRTGLQHIWSSHNYPGTWGHKDYEDKITMDDPRFDPFMQIISPVIPAHNEPVSARVLTYFEILKTSSRHNLLGPLYINYVKIGR